MTVRIGLVRRVETAQQFVPRFVKDLLEVNRNGFQVRQEAAEVLDRQRGEQVILRSSGRQADLSGDMALRIEKAFGVPMETLMRMQSSYDIVQTRQRAKLIAVRRYRKPAA
jgi:plasmid maintenance system antidote protein VapI